MQQGFDILIISTQDSLQEEFWQKRLRSLSGEICKPRALIITIAENWKGHAGTGLGMLYTYIKAQEKAKFKYHQDLLQMQREGASVAIYQTTCLEKKLFPLLACEYNSIASLKLPSQYGNLLETIIKQTNQQFSKNCKGRLSVFPCTQLFFSSTAQENLSNSHINLYCQTLPFSQPKKSVIALETSGPKVFETSEPVTLQTPSSKASNLNAYNLSLDLILALIEEFKDELQKETNNLDANQHFWMPLTLDYKTFLFLNPHPESQIHFHRMTAFKRRFEKNNSSRSFMKVIDIGKNGYWWDFSTVHSYYHTLLTLADNSPESHAMRLFFKINSLIDDTRSNRVITDHRSCLINSEIRGGRIKNSVLIGVEADAIEVENSVIINCNLSSLQSSNTLLYNVRDTKSLKLAPGTICSDILLPTLEKTYRMYSHLNRNSLSDWNTTLPQNAFSYAALHQIIENNHINCDMKSLKNELNNPFLQNSINRGTKI